MNVGILGSGAVAKALAAGFLKHGHRVTMGTREPDKLREWASDKSGIATGTLEEAATFGDIVVLAVKGSAAAAALHAAGPPNLAGKIVIDTTNPIADQPPEGGVLRYFMRNDWNHAFKMLS